MADDADTKPAEETPAAEKTDAAAKKTEAVETALKKSAESKPPAKETKEKPAATGDEPAQDPKGEGEGDGEGEKEEDGRPKTAEEVFLALEGDDDKPKILKAKGSKNVHSGIVHVLASYNNTKVTITDLSGNVIGWSTSGKLGFKGSRKSTAYAAQLVSQDACRQAMGHGLKTVSVKVKGPGAGRESAVRAVQNIGIEITTIKDVTAVPHNGCRPKKPRRV